MLRYFPLAAVLIGAPAMAQQAPQGPSSEARQFALAHFQQEASAALEQAYDLNQQLIAAQQENAKLKAQLAAKQDVKK
jgi:hypothetical protein